MCSVHKHRPAIPGRRTCADCRRRVNKRRANLRALGLCFCGGQVRVGHTICQACLDLGKRQRSERRARGLCSCGNPQEPGYKKCKRCLNKANARSSQFRSVGLCYCGKRPPKERYDQCQICLDKKQRRNTFLVICGQCQCGAYATGDKKMCSRCRAKARDRMRELLKNDPQFAATIRLRGSIYGAIIRKKKAPMKGRSEILLGCTFAFAQQHIESLFQHGMSWGNSGDWHIDHHIPCAAFDLSDERQQRLCSNWRNLRPLWVTDNLKKKDRLPVDYTIRLAELEAAVP